MALRKVGGKRRSNVSVRGKRTLSRHHGTRRPVGKKDEPLQPKERRQLLRMAVCTGVFLLFVAAKLLLPARVAEWNARLAGAMERNMDVQAVFSAVGKIFSGETETAADQVYQAVFQPEEGTAKKLAVLFPEEASAMEILRQNKGEMKAVSTAEESTALETQTTETAQISTLAYVLYSEQNLPERVSLEQSILNFDYCTPVQGTLSSEFGYREHPTEGEERFHYGLDLAAESGTAVSCFADGTVTAVGESSSYGKYCIVAHESRCSTLYAHCSRITVSSGATVSRGEKIAEVGETGMATGPHLHFELQQDGIYLNPIYYVSPV